MSLLTRYHTLDIVWGGVALTGFITFNVIYSSWARWYGSDNHVYAFVVLQWWALSLLVMVLCLTVAIRPTVSIVCCGQ
jgi:hypothetical protein